MKKLKGKTAQKFQQFYDKLQVNDNVHLWDDGSAALLG